MVCIICRDLVFWTHDASFLTPAIQVAKLSGYSPIITTASLRNEAHLKSLGATHVLDRSLPPSSIIDEIQKIAGGKPVEYVYDAISLADTQALGYDALAPGGTLIIVLDDVIPAEKKTGDNKRVLQSHGAVHWPQNRAVGAEFYKRLTEWLRTGVIVVRVGLRTWHYFRWHCVCADETISTIAEQGRGPPEWSGGDP